MRVKALISFVGYDQERNKYRVSQGDEFEMPAGVDWLEKGLVEEIKQGSGGDAAREQGSKKAKKSQGGLL